MDQLNKSINFANIDFTKILNSSKQNTDHQDPKPILKMEEEKKEAKLKISNKCSICKKKLILAATFDCACDEYKRYCPTHRFPEEHACSKEKSKINLVRVVADKLEKI